MTDVQVSIDASQLNCGRENESVTTKIWGRKKTEHQLWKCWNWKYKPERQIRDLERRSQQDNLRFDGIAKYENESWCDTEENLKDLLYQRLNIQWILTNVSSLKGTDFFINDGYSKETVAIRKEK